MKPPVQPAETDRLSIAECASIACLLEATAAKPGNVHRGADFDDLTYLDFVLAAQALGLQWRQIEGASVGTLVLKGVCAARRVTATNVNLGMVLLLAPMALAPRDEDLAQGVMKVLKNLTSADCRDVYEAIRLAQPGGLGNAETADVQDEPPNDLVAAMRLAADRDLVARQYANGFHEVLDEVAPALLEGIERGWSLQSAIVHAHLRVMAKYPDSLIGRKTGEAVARQSALRAAAVLSAGEPDEDDFQRELAAFDSWLRSDGRKRNPGTTADLIAAGLFVQLRDGKIRPPFRFYD